MKFRRYLQGLGDGEWSRQSLAYDELKQLVLRIANEHDGGIPPLRAPRIAGAAANVQVLRRPRFLPKDHLGVDPIAGTGALPALPLICASL